MLHIPIDQSSISSILSIHDKKWSGQIRDIILSAIIHIIWVLWFSRNQLRYNDKIISTNRAIQLVSACISLSGNVLSGKTSSSIEDFKIFKHFSVSIHPPRAPYIIQVNWYKSLCGWIKCNSDGASRGNLSLVACRGIFRDPSGAIMGCFSDFIGVSTTFQAEILVAIRAIEITSKKGWSKFLLQCDFQGFDSLIKKM